MNTSPGSSAMSTTIDSITEPLRSNASCQRCYRRKKKCSRELPRCGNCRHAQVTCSFEEQSSESALFPIAYVKELERKVAHYEEQLRLLAAAQHFAVDDVRPQSAISQSADALSSPHGAEHRREAEAEQPPAQLASELKHLSLEMAADRYLGSSSGVSFARLTQAVLKRLKPDQYAFGFDAGSFPQTATAAAGAIDLAADPASPPSTPVLDYPACLPNKEHAFRLAEYYWAHSHLLYPFVRKTWFMEQLEQMYRFTAPDDMADGNVGLLLSAELLSSPSWLFSMWMIFAIGSTTFSAMVPTASHEEADQYWKNAQVYFYSAISSNDIVALNALLLQISYSFFNRVGSNTWYLVGSAVRLAIGMGLHAAPNDLSQKLPIDAQQYRKRIFWCLYKMDRVVSIALGRPFGIRDEDVEIDLFADVDDENITADAMLPQSTLKASGMAVPLHIVALRKIAGEIFEQVYSSKNKHLSTDEKELVLAQLRSKLVDWRRNMPFPLPQSRVLQVPHTCTAWFDLNYYVHLVMLYRPSPLCPSLTLEKVHLIAEASVMAIREVATMHREQRYSFNWLNLFNVFSVTLTLIYAITAQPEPLPTYLERSDSLKDLEIASDILGQYALKLPAALKCQRLVQDIMQRMEAQTRPAEPAATRTSQVDINEPPNDFLTAPASGGLTPILFDTSLDYEYQMAYPSYYTGNELYDQLQAFLAGVGQSPETQMDMLVT